MPGFGFGKHLTKLTAAAAVTAGLAIAGPATVSAEEEMSPNTGNVSLSAGVDFTTEYFFRGIYQGPGNDEGLIVQPWADVSFTLTEDLSVYFGTWNSVITKNDQGAGGDDSWYESDVYAGLSLALPEGFGLDLSYIVLYGPAGGDIFAEEVDLSLSYDDSELLGDWAMSPYVTFAFETDGASDGVEGEGVYAELGFGPSFTIVESADAPIDLSIPFTFGFSLDDYYEADQDGDGDVEDEGFGYFDVGLDFSMPLAGIDPAYGEWSLGAGVHLLLLGDGAEAMDENGDSTHVIGTFGLSMSY